MREVCELCRGTVIKRLLHRSDGAAVVHRECERGHKQHRVTGAARGQTMETLDELPSTHFVMIGACDCNWNARSG
jgi:hypothetical protein